MSKSDSDYSEASGSEYEEKQPSRARAQKVTPKRKATPSNKGRAKTSKGKGKGRASTPRSKSKSSSTGRGSAKKAKLSMGKPLMKPSTDVAVVMAKVLALKAQMDNSSQDTRTLDDVDLQGVMVKKEVKVMTEDHVRANIEDVVVSITNSILNEQGFGYVVPSRSASNQHYIKALDRIVLKDRVSDRVFASIKNCRKTTITTRVIQLVYELCLKRIHVTKRDLFYTDVKLFTKQSESDDVLDDVACMIGCTRSSLNVVASEKGIVVGRISFKDDGDFIDCTKMGVGGKAIPPYIDRITDIKGDAKFIMLVEKDAAFMRLAEDRFYNQYPCIIITAKGQPDVATRLFLKKIQSTLGLPVLGLVDSDPYGLKILSVYMSGSKNMSYDSASLTTKNIHWLGVRPSDLDRYNIPEQCRLDMTEHDIKTGKELLKEDFIKKNPVWYKELEMMVASKQKAEIQALSNFGFQYLTQVYLPLKLQEGDWV